MNEGCGVEMPRYRCHKEVWALKIAGVKIANGQATITPDESGFAPFNVTADYIAKHNPQPGGYYVVYKDGYKSFSPGDAFEQGYTRTSLKGQPT